MRRLKYRITFLAITFLAILFLNSCKDGGEDQKLLLPTSITENLLTGGQADRIIADFHYLEGTERVDNITWSNGQTHYFEYDGSGNIISLRKVNVKIRQEEEYDFEYEEGLVKRITLVIKNLDAAYLQPIDSAIVGYLLYGYEEGRIFTELRYQVNGMDTDLVRSTQFDYDDKGNILRKTITEHGTNDVRFTEEFTYDKSKHALSGLNYYFTGDSHVNNMLTKISSRGNSSFTYEIQVNKDGYPDEITEQSGSITTRTISYTYFTP